jgi:polysaccharide pyruvyl transferase WcaK-like protein
VIPLRVELLNGYSRRNPGDGWLIELAAALIEEAATFANAEATITAVLVDASSWDVPIKAEIAPLFGSSSKVGITFRGLERLLSDWPQRRTAVLGEPMRIAVGGGYLRSKTLKEAATVLVVHIPQLLGNVSVMLPQSIGPWKWMPERVVKRILSAPHVLARDDQTIEDLSKLGVHADRVADMAVLEIAARGVPMDRVVGDRIVLSPRSVNGVDIVSGVHQILDFYPEAELAYQAEVGSANDDRAFQRSAFPKRPTSSVRSVLDSLDQQVPVMIAGRLHAALEAISRGVPAVHLGYERKSIAAFRDLGLADFVVDVRASEWASDAADAARRIVVDPDAYWARLLAQIPRLQDDRAKLIETLGVAMSRHISRG